MRHGIGAKLALAVLLFASGAATRSVAQAQTPSEPPAPTSNVPAGSSLLNPNVSVIGWFQAEAGDLSDEPGTQTFALREAELGIQANVDPYSRADFFISVSPEEGVDLEEGYLTLLTLPAGLSAKLGKFRNNFGKFNRTHPPETPFADRPLAAERFLGEEGLAAAGVSASWLIPAPVYLNLDAEVTNTPDRDSAPSFEAYRGKDLMFTSRLSTFFDVGEKVNFTLGASIADGANGAAVADTTIPTASGALRATLVGADVTLRWKNPRRAIYRSLIAQVEWIQRRAEQDGTPDQVGRGGFAYVDYQFARRWHAGVRLDMSESLSGGPADRGQLGFLTFTPSEFSLVSAQVRRLNLANGSDEMTYFLKTTFNIGPHGQHPF